VTAGVAAIRRTVFMTAIPVRLRGLTMRGCARRQLLGLVDVGTHDGLVAGECCGERMGGELAART
jgi:hypothetical protein